MSDWKLIETAPTDGTYILGHDWDRAIGIYGHVETYIVKYEKYLGEFVDTSSNENRYPTHWMPLPNPPEDK
jgi:hypothetical protein